MVVYIRLAVGKWSDDIIVLLPRGIPSNIAAVRRPRTIKYLSYVGETQHCRRFQWTRHVGWLAISCDLEARTWGSGKSRTIGFAHEIPKGSRHSKQVIQWIPLAPIRAKALSTPVSISPGWLVGPGCAPQSVLCHRQIASNQRQNASAANCSAKGLVSSDLMYQKVSRSPEYHPFDVSF